MRNGQQLLYRKELSDYIERNSDDPCETIRSPRLVELLPNKPTIVGWFLLTEGNHKTGNVKWYDLLEPGEYRLLLFRSLDCCYGEKVKSETIAFEVIP